jgi:hypothetical protein
MGHCPRIEVEIETACGAMTIGIFLLTLSFSYAVQDFWRSFPRFPLAGFLQILWARVATFVGNW